MKRKKPDEYFNNGLFEMARFGNVVETKNHMSPEVHSFYMKSLSEKCDGIKSEIEEIVQKIRALIRMAEPCNLMNYLITMNQITMMNKMSESHFSAEENMQLRCVEYAQSILVSEDEPGPHDSEDENLYGEILCLITELYSKMQFFYIYWGSKAEDLPFDEEEREYIVFSQLMSMVRGTQYQTFRIPILKDLLFPYESMINEAYGVGVREIVSGLEVLERNLSSGRLFAMNKIREQMDLLAYFNEEDLPEDYIETSRRYVKQAVGLDLFDVKRSTGWPDKLILDMTLEIGEDKSFLAEGDYSGWPIRNLPIKMKPFIKIVDTYYCFDYYNFFDNFYKAFRKNIVDRVSNGTDRWNDIQGHSSEEIVAHIFESLLPGAKVHLSNYYPYGKKESAENDILIEYRDVLFIVEVKAGAFTPAPAIIDYPSHKTALNNLVIKAENQALRVKQYIESSEEVDFYDGNDLKNKIFSIQKNNYNQLYMFDVTLADFNDIAAQMEKIKVADAKEDVIVLSLNDLWVYKNYFDSPFQFIHFIKQRTLATRARVMSISDELDHLGLYIDKNMYSLDVLEMEIGHVFYGGYREELDEYFSLVHLEREAIKPKQKLTKELADILNICMTKDVQGLTRFTNFLLDMSDDARDIFSETIVKLSMRELELGKMIPATFFGDLSYVLSVKEPNIEYVSVERQRQYVLATIAKNKREDIYRIEIVLDSKKNIVDIDFDYFTQSDIKDEAREKLEELGELYVQTRTQSFLIQNHKKKIYPNEYCPCGSGKKYKKCCGRK